jgi:hypothetical protein
LHPVDTRWVSVDLLALNGSVGTRRFTSAALEAARRLESQLTLRRLCLGVLTERAAQVAAFEEDNAAQSRAIMLAAATNLHDQWDRFRANRASCVAGCFDRRIEIGRLEWRRGNGHRVNVRE